MQMRFQNVQSLKISHHSFTVPEAVIADSVFLDFFNINLISGRKEDLGRPNKVFIAPDLAGIVKPLPADR